MVGSTRGSGNLLVPLAVVAVAVVGIIGGVLFFSEEDVPDQPTIIAEDDINAEPAGAGTLPEGEADEVEEGITELVDDVSPAPDDIDTIPAADYVDSTGPDIEGETLADEQVADTVNEELIEGDVLEDEELESDPVPDLTTVESVQAGGANAEQQDEPEEPEATFVADPDQDATEEFLIDEETVGTEGAEDVDTPGPQASTEPPSVLPDGRDALTDLDPHECQIIVRDTDHGGAPFIPTPSGPDANTREECLDGEAEE